MTNSWLSGVGTFLRYRNTHYQKQTDGYCKDYRIVNMYSSGVARDDFKVQRETCHLQQGCDSKTDVCRVLREERSFQLFLVCRYRKTL